MMLRFNREEIENILIAHANTVVLAGTGLVTTYTNTNLKKFEDGTFVADLKLERKQQPKPKKKP